MSAKHTPGRVKVQHPHAGPRGWEVAFEPGLEQLCQDITEDNARRLAACWNACEKVSTEDLESLKRPGDVSWAMTIDRLARERDELLAALQEAKANAGNPEAVYRITSAAIAKATGGAA